MSQEVKVITAVSILTVAILVGGIFLTSSQGQVTEQSQKTDITTLIRANSHKTTDEKKKVTLVEFGDFQCPACGAFYPIVKQLMDSHKDSMALVFRHFPLPQHANAPLAAEVAEAAGKQGKFWEMYNLLYSHQNEWAETSNARDIFIGYAKKININEEEFTKDIDSNAYSSKIDEDKNDGISLGVNSTPTFYLNGQKVENNSLLKDQVEQLLR